MIMGNSEELVSCPIHLPPVHTEGYLQETLTVFFRSNSSIKSHAVEMKK